MKRNSKSGPSSRRVDRLVNGELDHKVDDCEACLLKRCPWSMVEVDPNMMNGKEENNEENLKNIAWVFIDENEHIYNL